MQLIDNFERPIKYLRLSVTDRCNLRCFYCMPEEGIRFLPKDQLLSYEELDRISGLLIDMGIEKIRITGGEPFVRKDLITLLDRLAANEKLKKLSITTNGILTQPFLPRLMELGIHEINLSLDTTNKANFEKITRRDDFARVMDTFHQLIADGFKVKINAVIMDGINDHEIPQLAKLAAAYPISVRFIEEMPFNGTGAAPKTIKWTHLRIFEKLETEFGAMEKLPSPTNSTSENYKFAGAKGDVGIIAAYSRTFCGTCDRIRITSTGELRTCLYGHNVLDIKQILREGHSDQSIQRRILDVVQKRTRDGNEAEKLRSKKDPVGESMSTIGG